MSEPAQDDSAPQNTSPQDTDAVAVVVSPAGATSSQQPAAADKSDTGSAPGTGTLLSAYAWTAMAVMFTVWFWLLVVAVSLQFSVDCYGDVTSFPVGQQCGNISQGTTGSCLDGAYSYEASPSYSDEVTVNTYAAGCEAACSSPAAVRVVKCPNNNPSSGLPALFSVLMRVVTTNTSTSQQTTTFVPYDDVVTIYRIGGRGRSFLACNPDNPNAVREDWKQNPLNLTSRGQYAVDGFGIAQVDVDRQQFGMSCGPAAGLLPSINRDLSDPPPTPLPGTSVAITVENFTITSVCVNRQTFTGSSIEQCMAASGQLTRSCRICNRQSGADLTAGAVVFAGFVVFIHTMATVVFVLLQWEGALVGIPILGLAWGVMPDHPGTMHPYTRITYVCSAALTWLATILILSGGVSLRSETTPFLILASIAISIAAAVPFAYDAKTEDRGVAASLFTVKLTFQKKAKWYEFVWLLIMVLLADYDMITDVLFAASIYGSHPVVTGTAPTVSSCGAASISDLSLCSLDGTRFTKDRTTCNSLLDVATLRFDQPNIPVTFADVSEAAMGPCIGAGALTCGSSTCVFASPTNVQRCWDLVVPRNWLSEKGQ